MSEQEKQKLLKFMKTLPKESKMCINNLYIKLGITDLNELLELTIKCLEDKEDSSGGDLSGMKKEIGLFRGEMLEIQDKKEKLNNGQNQKIKKISHKLPTR